MLSFYEYLAQSRRMALPDTHTMLATAGVPLGFPDEEETVRLLNRDRKRQKDESFFDLCRPRLIGRRSVVCAQRNEQNCGREQTCGKRSDPSTLRTHGGYAAQFEVAPYTAKVGASSLARDVR